MTAVNVHDESVLNGISKTLVNLRHRTAASSGPESPLSALAQVHGLRVWDTLLLDNVWLKRA